MKKQISSFKEIYIANPCHEDWDKMSVNEKGRFCSNCKKTVHDFTDKTKVDFNLLYQLNKGAVCGRFDLDQINQDNAYIARVKINTRFSQLRKIVSIIITFIVLKLTSIRSAFAQQPSSTLRATTFGNGVKIVIPDPNTRRVERKGTEINGKVLDKEQIKFGISEATIRVLDSKGNVVSETLSDDYGQFKINLPDSLNLNQNLSISVSKPKEDLYYDIKKYSSEEITITEKEFDAVVIYLKVKTRPKRNLFGKRKKRYVMGMIRL